MCVCVYERLSGLVARGVACKARSKAIVATRAQGASLALKAFKTVLAQRMEISTS